MNSQKWINIAASQWNSIMSVLWYWWTVLVYGNV